jgi:hypothetical protein
MVSSPALSTLFNLSSVTKPGSVPGLELGSEFTFGFSLGLSYSLGLLNGTTNIGEEYHLIGRLQRGEEEE